MSVKSVEVSLASVWLSALAVVAMLFTLPV